MSNSTQPLNKMVRYRYVIIFDTQIFFMKQFFSLLLLMGFVSLLQAQTAKVQVIHNSPTPGTTSGPVVDIYLNGALLAPLTGVAFRQATPFLEVPAGTAITIDIKVSPSTPADLPVFTTTVPTLAENVSYQAIAGGVVGNATTPFNLYLNAAQETAPAGQVSLNVFHGAPDAPEVDVAARLVGTLFPNVVFGEFTSYLTVPAAQYYIDVLPAGTSTIVQTYEANVTGLATNGFTVIASGYLSNTPAFGLFAVTNTGTVIELPAKPVARVQVIHNSPTPTVDIWANEGLLLNNFAYQTATGFIYVDAGVEIDLGVALDNSTSASESLVTVPVTLENGKTYQVVAGGIVNNATTPFTLFINPEALEVGATDTTISINVFHGVTNANTVPVDVNLPYFGNLNLFENVAYGTHTDYLNLPAVNLVDISVAPTGTNNWVTLVEANLVPALYGTAFTIVATGLLGDATNPFDLLAVFPDGSTLVLSPEAIAQIIHNCPLAPAASVDIFYQGVLAFEDVDFRTATPQLIFPARVQQDIAVSQAGQPIGSALGTFNDVVFESGKVYTIYAGGDNSAGKPFTLLVSDATRFFTNDGNLDIRAHHGSTDAPAVDVYLGATLLYGDLSYGDFSEYQTAPSNGTYQLDIKPAGNNAVTVASFSAPLTGLTNEVIEVFASGYLNPTADQPGFGLWAALFSGTVVELPLVVSTEDVVGIEAIKLTPNPASVNTTIAFNNTVDSEVAISILDASGRIVRYANLGKIAATSVNQTFEISDLPVGMYWVSVANKNGYQTLPLQIAR
jgi:Domain of unknown function (DUF4397)/Secretion system C-terminal sorting domain